ncbi:MAG: xanthine dehydrogenase family protein subunit M [Gammaproteobacteria bacterium]|nr:xanthine dehydrogenase family protein subunit M [Gammaproteobacteria bacterium]MDH3414533.1 xanthine dehydrogenase family protein subunit M [Gammaproteobacteria bacterium]
MYNFRYQRASSLDGALKAAAAAEDPKFLAGGMTLLPTMKQRLAQPSDLIDIGGIADLAGIRRDGQVLVVGAMTRHADVASSEEVKSAIPALAALAGHIGDPQVRNRGTLGGSIANADPAADYPAAVVGLNATVKTNKREIAADDFFTGLFETVLQEYEIVTEVSFPIPEKAAYAKFPNPASRYAVVGVMVCKSKDGVRVAVTGAGPSVFRVEDMEKALSKKFAPEAVEGIKVSQEGLNADIHASAEYRAHLVTVMAKRAVAAANG